MAQNNPFSYLTFAQAKQALELRLNSNGADTWLDVECGIYITEALREWNCLTQQWLLDWTTTYTNASLPWQSTGSSVNTLVGANTTSPRYQTLTDSYVYTVAQYHLMEPPNGNATWAGTGMFSLADFTQALQRRRDQILQATACNVGPFSNTFGVAPGNNSIQLPDSVAQGILDIRRVRFIPAVGLGSPSTLYRDDTLAFEYFNNNFTTEFGVPFTYGIIGNSPQSIAFDASVSVPNTLDILAMISGGSITPPAASPLLIPDDWYWVLKFGMMADLLSKEVESTDFERAQYCAQRFNEGLQLMQQMPWMTQARINNLPVDTPSVAEADTFDYEWQSNPNAQLGIVRGGIDTFAVSPQPSFLENGVNVSVTMTLVGNAPVPVADGNFIQLSRDVLDVILDEAQHLATFKLGGQDWIQTMALHQNFVKLAAQTNRRLAESGIFESTLLPVNSRQNAADPRFAEKES